MNYKLDQSDTELSSEGDYDGPTMIKKDELSSSQELLPQKDDERHLRMWAGKLELESLQLRKKQRLIDSSIAQTQRSVQSIERKHRRMESFDKKYGDIRKLTEQLEQSRELIAILEKRVAALEDTDVMDEQTLNRKVRASRRAMSRHQDYSEDYRFIWEHYEEGKSFSLF